MLRNFVVALILIYVAIFTAFAHHHYTQAISEKTKCQTCQTKETKSMLSMFTLNELVSGKTVNLDLSNSKSVIVFLDKESIRDYNQVNNFTKWLENKKLDVKVYTIIQANNKEEATNWAKANNILSALWDTNKMLTQELMVEKYPIAYYIVNGKVVAKIDKLSVGHLRQMVYCEKCQEVKTSASSKCCKDSKSEKKEVKSGKENQMKENCNKEG